MVIALKDPDPRTSGKGIQRLRRANIEVTLGVGRETESLLMMVTPRIIINEEEEQRQVLGAAPAGPGGGAP